MTAVVCNGAEPFEQLNRRPHVKSGEICSSGFREENINDFTILYKHITQGQGQITPKILTAAKRLYFFNHTLTL